MTSRQFDEHREAAVMENVEFLISVGFHKDQIAMRLGMTRDTLDKKIERWRRRGSGVTDTSDGPEVGQDEGPGEVRPLRIARPERRVAPPEEQAG